MVSVAEQVVRKHSKEKVGDLPRYCIRCRADRLEPDADFAPRGICCRSCNRAYQAQRRARLGPVNKELNRSAKRLERAKAKASEYRSKAMAQDKANQIMGRSYEMEPPPPVDCDFETFRYFYLGVQEEHPVTFRFQNVGVTYPFMEGFVQALSDPAVPRVLAVWPVRHAKSRIMEQYVVYRLCQSPNMRVVIACGSEKLAKDRIYAIQQILLDANRYIALHEKWGRWLGKHPEKPWTSTEFYIAGRSSGERDPSVRAVGAAGDILGTRVDLLVLDDIDNPTNTFADRQKIMRTINTTLRTRMNEGYKIVAIGNRAAPDDVYSHFLERRGWWTEVLDVQVPRLVDGKDTGEWDPLCPELYSKEELIELSDDMTSEEYNLMLRNNPSAEGSATFTLDIVAGAEGNFMLGEIPEGWEVITGLDPSTSETAACVTVAFDRASKQARVIDCVERKAPRHDGLVAMLAQALTRHKPSVVVIEEQGGSHFFSDVPEVIEMIYDHGARLERFKTHGLNKHDPGIGIALVASEMSKDRLKYAWGNPAAQRVMRQLRQEMLMWKPHGKGPGGNHFDAVMALWFCINIIHTGRFNRKGRTSRFVDRLVSSNPWMGSKRVDTRIA